MQVYSAQPFVLNVVISAWPSFFEQGGGIFATDKHGRIIVGGGTSGMVAETSSQLTLCAQNANGFKFYSN